MAYMNQAKKKLLAPQIDAVLKKYGVKGTLSVRNHSTLVLTAYSGKVDFLADWADDLRPRNDVSYIQVNPYYTDRDFNGNSRQFFSDMLAAMNDGNHDHSDVQSDYFDVGWYVDINIGKWDSPYQVMK